MDDKFTFAQELIREAGQLIKAHLDADFAIETKADQRDLVTEIDRASQAFLMSRLCERYPRDGFLAEEEGVKTELSSGAVWVIDPIDGTVNFITQRQDFAVILAYLEDGVGQFGLIYDVMADRLYAGGGSFPVTCNGNPLPPAKRRPLPQALIACNTGLYANNHAGLADFCNQALGIRNYGCAGISLARVLSGQLWGYASQLCPWDYLAASIMGQALGYDMLSLDINPLDGASRQPLIYYPSHDRSLVIETFKDCGISWSQPAWLTSHPTKDMV